MTTTPEEVQQRPAEGQGAEKVARVYAEALLSEAWKQHQGVEILEDLDMLLGKVFRANPQLEEFLVGNAVGQEQKAEVIKSAFEGRAPELLVNFLNVLNDRDRLGLLRSIATLYRQLLDERLKQLRIRVRSAVPLAEEYLERLRRGVRELYQREPILETAVDPDVLGGLEVRVGDWLYDGSVRTQLENLQDQIIESSSHEIASR